MLTETVLEQSSRSVALLLAQGSLPAPEGTPVALEHSAALLRFGGVGRGVLCVLGILVILYFARQPRFKPHPLMTANGREFYKRLLAAFPECQVWPQVPILALLRPDAKEGSRFLARVPKDFQCAS